MCLIDRVKWAADKLLSSSPAWNKGIRKRIKKVNEHRCCRFNCLVIIYRILLIEYKLGTC